LIKEYFGVFSILIQGEKGHTLMKSQIAEFSEGKRKKIKRGLGRRSEVRTVLWKCSPPSNMFLSCRATSFRLESTAIGVFLEY
jgi:phage gp29-like protein